MGKSTAKQIKLPDMLRMGPVEAIEARKARDQGQMISSALRERLSRDLRATVAEHFEAQRAPAGAAARAAALAAAEDAAAGDAPINSISSSSADYNHGGGWALPKRRV